MSGFFGFLDALWRAITGVLGLDTGTAVWLRDHPQSLEIAVAVAVLAGISTLLGDSVVLFFNRLRGWRFAFTLVLNGVAMVALYLLQAAVVWLVGPLVTGHRPTLVTVATGVMVSTAPLVFGVFVLVPYFGPAIQAILQIWGLVALWLSVDVMFRTDHWSALLVTLLGWGFMQVLSWAFAKPVAWAGERIWRLISGTPAMITGRDLLSGHLFLPLGHRFESDEVN